MPETGRVVLEKTPFAAGLAVLENAHEQTARLQVVDRDELMDVEPGLLIEARGLMGRLPFEQLDMLVIGEIGKNYSGAGIDPNVVGRLLMEVQPETYSPAITRIIALDLSPESHGNAVGVGIADLTTDRLLAAIDPKPFRMNTLTSCSLCRSKLPLILPNGSRMYANRLGDVLAADPGQAARGDHSEYAGTGGIVGVAGVGGGGAKASAPEDRGGSAAVAVRREGELAAGGDVSA